MKQGAQQTLVALGIGVGLSLLAGHALAAIFFQIKPSRSIRARFLRGDPDRCDPVGVLCSGQTRDEGKSSHRFARGIVRVVTITNG